LRAQILEQAGRLDEALATARRALHLAREQENPVEHAWACHLLGLLLLADGRPDAAYEWVRAALAEAHEVGYPFHTASATRAMAAVSAARGELAAAADLFGDALDRFVRAGCHVSLGTTVAAALPLLLAAGRRDTAATVLAGLDSSGVRLERVHVPMLDALRHDLADGRTSAASTARGEALRLEEIFTLARQEIRDLRRTGPAAPPAGPVPVAPPAGPAAELRRVGDLWQVAYAGATVHLPDLKGMSDLATLLGRPGQEVAALDLAVPAGHPRGVDSAATDRLGSPGDLGERIDAQARAAYAARIRELQADLDEADTAGDAERGAAAQYELDVLTRELSSAYGLQGPRRSGDPAERARAAVTARIRVAVAKIRDAHPTLGAHLDRSVRTGRFCVYRPDPPVTWRIVRPEVTR
jgi:tetratricopeptide (TPR) repeat protein